MSTRRPRRGDRLELTIERLDGKGRGVGSVGRWRFAARGALPGARVEVEVLRSRGALGDARVRGVLSPSPDEEPARCPHEESCGGCAFQRLAYGRQLEQLHERVSRALGGVGFDAPVDPVVGMDVPWHYRNKMEYTFGNRRFIEPGEPEGVTTDFALGMHSPGWFEKVIDLRACAIHFEGADELVAHARDVAREQALPPWDIREHAGLLRYLVLRRGLRTGEVLVNLVTSGGAEAAVDAFAAAFLERAADVYTFVHSTNTRTAATAQAERERVVHGPGHVHEVVGELTHAISAGSFFQTNTLQAERLFAIVAEEARLTGDEVVLDLYCGAGTIGLALAGRAREVRGFEVVPSAVADARANATTNGVSNASFVLGDVLDSLAGPERGPDPDVVVVDPPRAGLEARMVPALARLAAPRLVYVSCNVDAACRDLPYLRTAGYRLERARPVDLFPHTPHVEVVFTLSR